MMIIAVEDRLGEAVLRKILAHYRPTTEIAASVGLKGKSYLQSKASELNRTARQIPVIVLIDLDLASSCPVELAAAWFPNGMSTHMHFRAAILEVESWLMADRQAMARFLRVSPANLPANPDSVLNPKEHLVNLARRSRSRALRADIVPAMGSSASVGPGYNPLLTEFIAREWSPAAAQNNSTSLNRFVNRLVNN